MGGIWANNSGSMSASPTLLSITSMARISSVCALIPLVHLAPLPPILSAVLFVLPFNFTQELDPGAVHQQIQCGRAAAPADQAAEPKPSKPAKVMISLQMPADLLAKVDGATSALSLTRSRSIKLTLGRTVQAENS
jgi:hypothetical protein